jgi:suppressor for copper-sensitivity B
MLRSTIPALRWFPSFLLLPILAALPAHAAIGEWVMGDHVRMRLVAAGGAGLGAAVELELEPGWKTYWRTPGDAGIPPVFDFAGSSNLGPVEVRFPVPERVDDGFSISNVYHGRVVLPLAAAVDAAKPVDIALAVDLGVCADICIPARVEASLSVPAGETDPEAASLVAAAAAALPGPPEPGAFAVEGVARTGGSDNRPGFTFTAEVPDPDGTTVFVEGPPDWFATVPVEESRDGARVTWRVEFDRLGSVNPLAGAALRFTLVSAGRAIEQAVALD